MALVWASVCASQECGATEQAYWPGDTTGGLAGRIVKVTNLNEDGPGSLREALQERGPRLVVFEVGGTIWLKEDLIVNRPYVTVAGQTAPSPGITLAGATLSIKIHDVVVQHVRVRVGDRPGPPKHNRDGIQVVSNRAGTRPVHSVVIDHCSISWALDEGINLWNTGVRDVVIRNSIIAEGLRNAGHPEGPHSTGFLIGRSIKGVVIRANLFAHNNGRNPVIAGGSGVILANNLIYDFGRRGVHFARNKKRIPLKASIVGNVGIAGPSTGKGPLISTRWIAPGSAVFVEDNLYLSPESDGPVEVRPEVQDPTVLAASAPIWVSDLEVLPATETTAHVLANAGARPWDRDAVDERILAQVRNRTGGIIDSQDQVGGWPAGGETRRPLPIPAALSQGAEAEIVAARRAWLKSFETRPGD